MLSFNREKIKDKIYACWVGKNIGGTMGAPYEGKTETNDVSGFTTPEGAALPNDDLDLQLIWLRACEEFGPFALNAQILAEHWVNHIPPYWNEYGICKSNLKLGLMPPLSGDFKNNWKHSNGAWIRTEIWACMAPGAPDIAIKYAIEDACVDHGMGEGTYAAVFVAAMESAAFVEQNIRRLIEIGLSKIPEDCRVSQSVRLAIDCYDKGVDRKEARELLVENSKDLGWFHAPCNVAFVILGMLYGEGDFKKSMIYAINCGDDTDCTAATLGALFGIIHGSAGIPKDWAAYIGDTITTVAIDRSSCRKLPKSCTELTQRVMEIIPITLYANHAMIELTDGQEDLSDYDFNSMTDPTAAATLLNRSGKSIDNFISFAKSRLTFGCDPEITPCEQISLKLELFNTIFAYQHIKLRLILPEGWSASCPKTLFLPRTNIHLPNPNYACTEFKITAGENVEAINRIYLELISDGHPTVGIIPIVLFGK